MTLIKKNIAFISAAAVGLLNFIWLIIPYVVEFSNIPFVSKSDNVNGYKVMGEFWSDFGFGGVMSGLFQIFAVIAGVLLLAVGAVGILRGFDVVKGIPEAVAGFSLKKIAKILLLAFVAIEILLLIFLIVLCVANTSEQSGYQYGVKFSAGMFVSLAFAIIGAALPFVIKEG